MAICQVSLVSALVSKAAAPAPLAGYSESYNELVSHGGKIWAIRYQNSAAARLVIGGGVTVNQAEFALPPRTLRVAAAPNGVFYAVASGIGQSGLNPGIFLWEGTGDGNWIELGEIRGADPYVRTRGAGLLFFGRSVIVNLSVEWNLLGPGSVVVSILANGNAWYLLRRSGVETKLDCMVIPAVEISIATRPGLNLISRNETIASGAVWTNFVTGVTTVEAVERQVIDLSVEPTSNAFTQLETSTNLENWTAVGLPVPTGKTATFVINPDEPRRFYR